MQKEEIKNFYAEFIKDYDEGAKASIWKEKSRTFHDFWRNSIMNGAIKDINENEVDEIIRILDKNGKGNKKGDESVAKVLIPQGVWRRMFKEIKNNKKIQEILNKVFFETDNTQRIKVIDELRHANEGRKNGLTGKSGNAINAMLGAFDPFKYIHVVSLNDRRKIIDFFTFQGGPDFDNDGFGKKIVESNQAILEGFKQLDISTIPRTISRFLYESPIKAHWRKDPEPTEPPDEDNGPPQPQPPEIGDISLFYMESQLEDFLIENWDKTELGKKYDLIEENGEIVSQQYTTGIGKIDILAQDKKTKQYVVVELKKNQTSDDTVGQLTRYMGWLEENKPSSKEAKGIIIAARYDERLYYALKKVKDVEVYLYRVDFKLQEFKKGS